ncbi:hypothetical protein GCM10010965_27710 [Caldalkalibacillus thermarum]|uniref:cell wall-binding repeat-containing protein n=1 Tax=Caldalkalibacillus thermarum TaxID=296745 RepID=UPI001665BFFD|nr:cell wall-binding repeat-containing protein [Caldalkalibacillus thermarum]GGK33324.1 hypothetical protein GCM10010965_27710 [Caldalkalibacillus thermarum]
MFSFKKFKNLLALLLVLVLVLTPFAIVANGQGVSAGDGSDGAPVIDPQVMNTLQKEEYAAVLVKLKAQVDTTQVAQTARLQVASTSEDLNLAQRQAVIHALKEVAAESQADIIAYLHKQQKDGHVQEFKPFYIVNALYVKANKAVIEELGGHPAVEEIILDQFIEVDFPKPAEDPLSLQSLEGVEWNISRVKAPEVWDKLGIDGTGVVVGLIDTGVFWKHETLKEKWRGYNPDNPQQPNPKGNWFDAVHGKPMPYDEALIPHGTHVLGTILGQDPAGKNKIGVAPGAKWVAAKAFTAYGGQMSWLLAAGEFMLAPNGDPQLAPDVINNSWGAPALIDDWYRDIVRAWRDAGIVPVFAAGNDYYLVGNPANYPESIAVGATDITNKRAPFSNTGPGVYAGAEMKPELVAPGMYVRSAVGNGYDYYDGTSMAAPHVAGVVALLRSADPALSVDEIEEILKQTATPLMDEEYSGVPNYGYGYGLVNAYQAVASVYTPEGVPVIIEPRHGAFLNEETVVVKGETPADGTVTVYVNEEKRAETETSNQTFAVEVELDEGQNTIMATLTVNGEESDPSVPVVIYKDSLPPFVQLLDFEHDLVLMAGDPLTVSFIGDSGLKNAELMLVERNRAAGPFPFEEVYPGFYQAEWIVEEGYTLSFAEVIVTVEDKAGNTAQVSAPATVTVLTDDNRIERLSGPDRYETAVEISQAGWRQANTVVIARGDHYADALAGVPLAYQYDAPILLTKPQALPEVTKAEIERLGAQHAVILGGEKAIDLAVAKALEEMGLDVDRIEGVNRYDTAAKIARHIAPLGSEKAVLVNGQTFADALSVAAFAAQERYPILLTPADQLAPEAEAALADLGVDEVIVVGGDKVISPSIADQLPGETKRIAGDNRYETSAKVAQEFREALSYIYVTTGEDFADALTGSVLAAKRHTGVILVQPGQVPAAVDQLIGQYPIVKMDILGGEKAVSAQTEAQLKKKLVRY